MGTATKSWLVGSHGNSPLVLHLVQDQINMSAEPWRDKGASQDSVQKSSSRQIVRSVRGMRFGSHGWIGLKQILHEPSFFLVGVPWGLFSVIGKLQHVFSLLGFEFLGQYAPSLCLKSFCVWPPLSRSRRSSKNISVHHILESETIQYEKIIGADCWWSPIMIVTDWSVRHWAPSFDILCDVKNLRSIPCALLRIHSASSWRIAGTWLSSSDCKKPLSCQVLDLIRVVGKDYPSWGRPGLSPYFVPIERGRY